MKKFNNHFIMQYTGNKRGDYKNIIDDCNLENIDTIIEPFCGTCAFSYFLARDNPKKYKYILNDKCKNLIDIIEICQDSEKLKDFENKINEIAKDLTKEKYDILRKKNDIYGFFLMRKINHFRIGIFPLNYKYKVIKISDCPFINFIQNENVSIMNENANDIFEKYKNDDKTFLFCDPPYMLSDNGFYDNQECNKNSNIYKYVYDNDLNQFDCKILFCLELNWLVELLFKKYNFKKSFSKKYGQSKKKMKLQNITNY